MIQFYDIDILIFHYGWQLESIPMSSIYILNANNDASI